MNWPKDGSKKSKSVLVRLRHIFLISPCIQIPHLYQKQNFVRTQFFANSQRIPCCATVIRYHGFWKRPFMTIIILLGPPGSGKGTQADLLHHHLQLPHISTGEILRQHVRQKTTLGQAVSDCLNKGHLVPDPLILDILFERTAQPDCQKGYILDGFPRTTPQAKALQERLGSKQPIVFNLMLTDKEIISRLTQRRVCPHCQSLYHLTHKPPQKEGTCDACQTPLIQRSDDTEAVIAERLRVYHAETAPLIAFYTQLINIDCSRSKADILADIQRHLCER